MGKIVGFEIIKEYLDFYNNNSNKQFSFDKSKPWSSRVDLAVNLFNLKVEGECKLYLTEAIEVMLGREYEIENDNHLLHKWLPYGLSANYEDYFINEFKGLNRKEEKERKKFLKKY